ncbi:hypothetical protein [Maritimibacter sp. DP1N21-5]|uniref:hypothetical protein n=1 Tax=Maritimibacter sp. DP1N21-5 TaxID=2836867 RepID=UPI001C46D11B|nr:hypothetical protein [Maritimibacter sp. DP1N21-5]MBV7407713.1 hypothetical protein [Maritimibacter sp. DP1N21-5]
MTRTIFFSLVSLAIAATCLAVLTVLTGRWDALRGVPLTGQIVLNDIAVPADYVIDPLVISDELVARMQKRSEADLALNILLGENGNELLRDRAIPRLVNAGVVRRMLDEMEGLGTVIAFGDYHAFGRVRVTNRGEDVLNTVALVMPEIARAERSGEPLEVRAHENGLMSVALDTLDPGEAAEIAVWFTSTPDALLAQEDSFGLGALGALRGEMHVYRPSTGWNGAELQVRPWARWIVAAVLSAVCVAALATLALLIAGAIRGRRVSRA